MDKEIRAQAVTVSDLTFDLLRCCEVKEKMFAKEHNLKVAEFRCLRIMDYDTVYSVHDLAMSMKLSASRLTRIIDGLVANDLVKRVQSNEDRRYSNISLTTKGRAVVQKLQDEYTKIHLEMLTYTNADNRREIIRGISLMHGIVQTWLDKNFPFQSVGG
ncbi:MAG: MarR family transcriptional regulator [Candidatus Marinimicrobia bacterium]|nr:MarR family transcriptional regulator [Candidatus Neomarinimicrobiota bacterium]MCF7839443.1 MarR family transcriptional regulator [Candidatus Neomarinimicrobiota bacterium]MCF7902902.1 MarR family transcriptional regulator [Candidatus Neomarinimicrobiota bacterium]